MLRLEDVYLLFGGFYQPGARGWHAWLFRGLLKQNDASTIDSNKRHSSRYTSAISRKQPQKHGNGKKPAADYAEEIALVLQ